MKLRMLGLAIVLAVLEVPPAMAHPHIFASYDVAIVSADPGFIKLHFTFTFQGIMNPLYTPGSPALDRPQLQKDMLANITAHPFLLYLDIDGQSMGRQMVRPVIIGSRDDGNPTYVFDLTVPDTASSFGFSLYDPDYFVSVRQSGANAVQAKVDKFACAIQEQQVGKTVWGILRTQYVQCASKGRKPPSVKHFTNPAPGELPPGTQDSIDGKNALP